MKFWALTIFTLVTIVSGIIGFYTSINILTPTDESHIFFEIKFNDIKKVKIENLITNRIAKLNVLIPKLRSELDMLGPEKEEQSGIGLDDLATDPDGVDKDQKKKQILKADKKALISD